MLAVEVRLVLPPVTSSVPSASGVTVCSYRGLDMLGADDHVLLTGSYSRALAVAPDRMPPAVRLLAVLPPDDQLGAPRAAPGTTSIARQAASGSGGGAANRIDIGSLLGRGLTRHSGHRGAPAPLAGTPGVRVDTCGRDVREGSRVQCLICLRCAASSATSVSAAPPGRPPAGRGGPGR